MARIPRSLRLLGRIRPLQVEEQRLRKAVSCKIESEPCRSATHELGESRASVSVVESGAEKAGADDGAEEVHDWLGKELDFESQAVREG